MRTRSLKTQILTLAACAVLGAAAALAAGAALLYRSGAEALLAGAPERLAAAWEAEGRALARDARALAADPSVRRLAVRPPPDAAGLLARRFTAALGREPDPARDVVAVIGPGGTVAARIGPDAAGSDPVPGVAAGTGLRLAGETPLPYAALALDGDAARLLVARLAGPERVAAWARAAGGDLQFFSAQPAGSGRFRLAPARAWPLADGGPWVRVEAPAPFAAWGDAGWLVAGSVAAAALLFLAAAAVVADGIVRPLRAIEATAARVAAGEAPPPASVRAGAEVVALAAAVNRMREALDQRDRALRESARRMKTLQEEAVDALFLFDRTGRVRDVNAKAVALTGFDRDALLQKDVVTCVAGERPLQEEVYRRFMACLEGTPAVFETRFSTAEGGAVPVEVSAGLIPHLEEPTVQAFVRDITARRQLEAQLAQAEKMEGIGTLAGGIAHDFNNILSGILGYASLIKGLVPEQERIHRYTDIIERSATRGSELTQQLLGYARGGKYQVSRVRLNDVVEEVIALLRKGMGEKGITVDTQLDTHLPATEADAGQMHQVLTNLCVNARDAMPGGGRLRVVSEAVQVASTDPDAPPGLAPGRYVRVTVADTGQGMSREVQRKMFEPFFTTKPPGEGTGLGLAMVYGIVKNHGGQISVASRPGHGTAVRIYLPALEGTVQMLPRRLPEVPGGAETVLVVDDEVTILELAREILTDKGYGVVLARNGEEAVHVYGEYGESIPLVVLDIVMPRMGGKETYRHLKALNPGVKVVVSSGFSRHGQAHDLLEMGADAFVQKPYRPEELATVVRKTLDTPPKAMVQSA